MKAFSFKNNDSIQNLQFLAHFGMDSQGKYEEKAEILSFLIKFEIDLGGLNHIISKFHEKK